MVKIFRTKKRLKMEEKVDELEKRLKGAETLISCLQKTNEDLILKFNDIQLTLNNLTDENTTSKTAQQLLNEYFYGEQK